MCEFDVNGYNSHECDIHNHGYYLGAQSQQAKIDDLQVRIDEALEYLNNLSWASELDVENATNILKGNKDE